MRIIILHGDDVVKSYDRLQKFVGEAKHRSWKITEFSLEEVTNQSLFGEESFYVLHDYKILTKKILEKLQKYSGNLIVYNQGKIPAPTLKNLGANKIELFELPQLLWKFLDNMTIMGLHELIKSQAVEYILAMMAWKFKQNYLKNSSEKNAKLISDLAEIDIKSKTGKADLLLSLDLLLSKKLV
ncbi:MAG: hypothetical protein AAB625_02600 [Patescibacteria group bacterium]